MDVSYEQLQEAAEGALTKPSDFGYFGDDDQLWDTTGLTFGRHRDSENIEVAQFERVWCTLVERFPELIRPEAVAQEVTHEDASNDKVKLERNVENPGGIYVFGASHWAVGWVENIVVPIYTKDGEFHPAFEFVTEEAISGFNDEDYEVGDEWDREDTARNVKYELDRVATQHGRGKTEQWPEPWELLYTWIEHEGYDEWDWSGDQVLAALVEFDEVRAYGEEHAPFPGQIELGGF